MSNLEHLIENTLVAMEDGRPYNDVILGIKMDINFPACNLTEQEVWEICQYVKYTWCAELEGKIGNLEKQLSKRNQECWQWANQYAELLKKITDELLERSEANED